MRIVGIDPGFASCGVALLEEATAQRWRPLVMDTIRTPPGQPLATRLHTVWHQIGEVIVGSTLRPAVMSVEAQARAHAGYRERGQTSDNVLAVREVTGLLRALAWQHGLVFIEVEPAAWRACLGLPARASKAQVRRMVQALLAWQGRLSEHAADAAGVALGGHRHFRSAAVAARK